MKFHNKLGFDKPFLEIDLSAIKYNYLKLNQLSSPSKVCAVVKANAYGCGIEEISKTLINIGCKDFFVAKLEEGIQLREFISNENKIFIFDGLVTKDDYYWKKFNLIPVCNTIKQVNLAIKLNIPGSIHIDTGINRLGVPIQDAIKYLHIKKINKFDKWELILSHFACADNKNSIYNNKQIERFNSINHLLRNTPRSLANSHGIYHFKNSKFDYTRPGIALFGYLEFKQKILKPAVRLFAPILQIKRVNKNEEVGYGCTYRAKRDGWICIVGIGYADGLKRIISNKAKLRFKNFKVPIIGRISMDTTILDLTDLPINKINNLKYFPIINKYYSVNDLAIDCETIPYEILTSFGNRIKRVYKD